MPFNINIIKRYAVIAGVTWSLVIAISYAWFHRQQTDNLHATVRAEALIAFQKDTLYRQWVSSHGGVYVPVTSETPPNPNLSHVEERDISTPSGKQLTLVNPAYMTRQVFELAARQDALVKGHITSLNPIRPENAPDQWESGALKSFEAGTKEVFSVQEIDGKPYMRLMRPFIVDPPCLKCHSSQGYKTGDIRGGISVSVPMSLYTANSNRLLAGSVATHGLIWFLGIGMITFGSRKLTNNALELQVQYRQLDYEVGIRKQAEESALTNSMRLQMIMDSTYAALYGVDTSGACTFANKTCLTLIGYDSEEEVLGRNMHDLIHHTLPGGQPAPHTDCRIFQAYRKGEGVRVYDEIFWRKDGSSFPVEYSSYPISSDGIIVGAVISFIDISERKQAEDALKASEEKFATAFRACPAMIAIVSLENGRYVDVNDAFYSITGYTPEEVVGRTSTELGIWPDIRDRQSYLDQLATNGAIRNYEAQFRMRNGAVRDFLVSSDVIEIQRHRFSLNFVLDITDLKRADEDKAKLEAQLLQAQKMESIGRLAGGVAHDFNNLLTVILGHAELAKMKLDPSDPVSADIAEISKAGQRSTALTHQLLAFARKQTVAPKVLDLNETVKNVLKMLTRLIGEDIDLAWQPYNGLWHVKIDPTQVDQILANLCVNARDAIEGVGKITIETHNRTFDGEYCETNFGYTPGEYVLIAVSDDGCGMDKATLAHVFEPFFTTKGVGEGTGLGLATVYGIVKQNNGFINVYSEPEHGTTFRIYLPRHDDESVVTRIEPSSASLARGQETILLVEDEPSILTMTAQLLELQGYSVLLANGPYEAIERAATHPGFIHLLMTDVVMPGMNGRDLSIELTKLRPEIKCLFSSGYTANVIAHHGVLDNDVQFISKPFSLPELSSKVREVLDHP